MNGIEGRLEVRVRKGCDEEVRRMKIYCYFRR